jgi:nucleoside-diphosphate-sugar epimerase
MVVLGTDERAVGRAWHVPSPPPLTLRELARRLAAAAGAPEPRLRTVPAWLQRVVGLGVPMVRELAEVRHQHVRPFVLDSAAFTGTFGVEATPIDVAVKETADWWRVSGR